jgi:hypothetical protein
MYPGTANVEEILQAELTGKYIKRVQETQEERGKMLVMGKTPYITNRQCLQDVVSGTCKLRDHLRALVRTHLDDGVQLQELDFQPK